MTTIVRFPDFPVGAADPRVSVWANALKLTLETTLVQLQQQAGSGYFVTGYTLNTRSYDNTAPSVTQIGNLLCTLINDLRNVSKLG